MIEGRLSRTRRWQWHCREEIQRLSVLRISLVLVYSAVFRPLPLGRNYYGKRNRKRGSIQSHGESNYAETGERSIEAPSRVKSICWRRRCEVQHGNTFLPIIGWEIRVVLNLGGIASSAHSHEIDNVRLEKIHGEAKPAGIGQKPDYVPRTR